MYNITTDIFYLFLRRHVVYILFAKNKIFQIGQ